MKKQLIILSIFLCANKYTVLGQFQISANTGQTLNLQTSNTNRLSILTTGNIGIGTFTPVSLLHNHQSINASKNVLKFTNTLSGITATDGLDIGFEPNVASARLWNFENGSIAIGTNNVERVNISSTGNMGLGVSNTVGYKLYVNGATAITGNLNLINLSGTGTRPVLVDESGFLLAPESTAKFLSVSSASARNIGNAPSTSFAYMATACLAYFSSGVKYGEGKMVMPVEFPDNAVITDIYLHSVDNINGGFLIADLMKVPKVGSPIAQSSIAQVSTASLTTNTSVQESFSTLTTPQNIDNSNFYYYINLDISASTPTWGNNALAVRGVSFKYNVGL